MWANFRSWQLQREGKWKKERAMLFEWHGSGGEPRGREEACRKRVKKPKVPSKTNGCSE